MIYFDPFKVSTIKFGKCFAEFMIPTTTDAREWVYYKLTYEPSAQVTELKKAAGIYEYKICYVTLVSLANQVFQMMTLG